MISYPAIQKFFDKELPKLLERINNLEKEIENLKNENVKLQSELHLR